MKNIDADLIGNEIMYLKPRRYTWKTLAGDATVALAIVAFVALLLYIASITG